MSDRLPDNFDLDFVKRVLEEHFGNQIDERIVAEVFERAKRIAGYYEQARTAVFGSGYSDNGFFVTASDLICWYQLIAEKRIRCF